MHHLLVLFLSTLALFVRACAIDAVWSWHLTRYLGPAPGWLAVVALLLSVSLITLRAQAMGDIAMSESYKKADPKDYAEKQVLRPVAELLGTGILLLALWLMA